MGSVVTDLGKSDSDIPRHIGIAKNAFQELSKVLREKKSSLKRNKNAQKSISYKLILCNHQCWVICLQMKKKSESDVFLLTNVANIMNITCEQQQSFQNKRYNITFIHIG